MKSIEDLDRWIGGVAKRWSSKVSGGPHTKALLEIRREILNEIRDKIEPRGNGEYLFPYNDLSLQMGAQDSHQRGLFEAAFAEDGSLERDIREFLEESGCQAPAGLRIKVEVLEDSGFASIDKPFQIEFFHRKGSAAAKSRPARPPAKLTVLRGAADLTELVITEDRVNIGRMKEVMGEKDGLRRRNDIAFADTETTVSREHAYLSYDSASGKFRLYDHLSQRGTNLFRDGRRIEVSRGSTRGVQLQSGDEIHFGDARVRFEILPE